MASSETIQKLRESHIGYVMPQSQKDNISKNNKDKHSIIPSEETRHKQSVAKKGKSLSEEHKKNIGISNKGKTMGSLPRKGSGNGRGCYYISPYQGSVWLKSTYELSYAHWLDSNNKDWLYEPNTFVLSNGRGYTPDFYLIHDNKFIEIKGYMNETAREKIELFEKEYFRESLAIFYGKDLKYMGLNISCRNI